jgi:hypothetical protein
MMPILFHPLSLIAALSKGRKHIIPLEDLKNHLRPEAMPRVCRMGSVDSSDAARWRAGMLTKSEEATQFLCFLLPSRSDAGENLTGLLDVAIRPEPNAHAANLLYRRCLDRFGVDVTLQGNECHA